MLLLIFTNIFIHIQQPNLHSRNIFIHIYLCISYSRLYLLTFTRCLHSHSTSYIHSHSRSKYSFNIFCASPLHIGQYKTHSRPQRPRSFWSAPRIATSGFTGVKRLGTRVNTRVIYALPVTFPLHPTKFPRSTSATRAISVLSSIILPLQTFFSRVLLLRQHPF